MELPPVVELLLSENLHLIEDEDTFDEALARGLKAELVRQADWSVANFAYSAKPAAGTFAVTPFASLNPLSQFPHCSHPPCVSRYAATFTRTVALYSDVAVIPDLFTHVFAEGDAHHRHQMFYLSRMLCELEPLLRAGILRFGGVTGGPAMELPQSTYKAVAEAAVMMAEQAAGNLRGQVIEEGGETRLLVSGLPVEDDEIFFRVPLATSELSEIPGGGGDDHAVPVGHLDFVRRAAAHEAERLMRVSAAELAFGVRNHTQSWRARAWTLI